MNSEDLKTIIALRAKGFGWARIEREMGWPDSHGMKPWRMANADRQPPEPIAGYTISLWKAVAGGRSFRDIERALSAAGIPCTKGEKSEFEDRYEVIVPREFRERAEDILFRPVGDADSLIVQRLAGPDDPTK